MQPVVIPAPASALIEMAMVAGRLCSGQAEVVLANITIQYYDTYNSVPINDSDVTDNVDVLINVTNIPSIYWTLYNGPSNGYYIVEINTSYWSTLNEIGHSSRQFEDQIGLA